MECKREGQDERENVRGREQDEMEGETSEKIVRGKRKKRSGGKKKGDRGICYRRKRKKRT